MLLRHKHGLLPPLRGRGRKCTCLFGCLPGFGIPLLGQDLGLAGLRLGVPFGVLVGFFRVWGSGLAFRIWGSGFEFGLAVLTSKIEIYERGEQAWVFASSLRRHMRTPRIPSVRPRRRSRRKNAAVWETDATNKRYVEIR